jgi:hypothetical protein
MGDASTDEVHNKQHTHAAITRGLKGDIWNDIFVKIQKIEGDQ